MLAVTCTECGHTGRYKSRALADFHFPRHSCDRRLRGAERHEKAVAQAAAVDRTPKPCLHPVARHQHGTSACYVLDKCRCWPCAKANTAVKAHRTRQQAYGRWQPYVDAQPTREHVEKLRAAGMGLNQIGKASGVAHGVLSKLIYGERGMAPSKRIRWETAIRLQAVHADLGAMAARNFVDGTGTRRRVQALVALGWSQSQLAERLGKTATNFSRTCTADTPVRVETARAVAALYDRLWDTRPPETGHREKIAASRARRYAAQRGWVPPLAWDGTDIDDPAAHPNATGYHPERVAAVMAGALVDGDLDLALALTRVDRLECLRRGRAAGWTTRETAQRTGLDAAQLNYDAAAERAGRTERGAAELDQIAVARLMDGTLRLPVNAKSPELVEAVRRLAARGLPDTAIGERVGRDTGAVLMIRHRNDIPTPPRPGTAQPIDGIPARHGASEAATRNTPEDPAAA